MPKMLPYDQTDTPGFEGLWFNYRINDSPFKGYVFWLSFIFSLGISLIGLFTVSNNILVSKISNTITFSSSILPNIVGFNLAAFTLIVGLGGNSDDFIRIITKPYKGYAQELYEKSNIEPASYFQLVVAKFGFGLYFQTIFLGITIFLQNLLDKNIFVSPFSEQTLKYFNCGILFVFLFGLLYSIFLLPQMVINVFNYSQIHQRHYKKKFREIESKQADSEDHNVSDIQQQQQS